MKPLRHIGLNIVFLEPGMGGMETYVRHLIPGLLELRPDVRFTAFVNKQAQTGLASEPWADAVEIVSHPLLGQRYTRALSEMTVLSRIATTRRIDLLHSMAMTAPLHTPIANVITLPDLIWYHHPDSLPRLTTSVWRMIVPPIARRADRIITFSRASRDDIVRDIGVPGSRIDVVELGYGMGETAKPTPESELRSRLDLGRGPIVLTVSTKRRHKNLVRLVQAMSIVRQRFPDIMLVIPGHHTAHEDVLKREVSRLGQSANVHFLEWLSDEDLEGLYGCSTCFVYPSLREGFGLPILEAMRRDLPVACSNVSSLPEVAGDAARYFDPYDPAAIAGAICDLLEPGDLAARLVSAGRTRCRRFTWEATAEKTIAAYERAAGAP